MTQFKLIGLITAVVFLSAFTIANRASYTIDKEFSIKFSNKKASGDFDEFSGDIVFDEENLEESKFDVEIVTKSIGTGNWLKNRHAKGKGWFNANEYPTINFTSSKISKSEVGYVVTGTLNMHGIQKEIKMPFTFIDNVFRSSFTVDRTDYNIGGTTGMSGKVPHEIQLDIAVPVSK